MRPFVLLLVASCLVACSGPEPEPERESMIDRNTPLNEEVDEVSKVRDEVLDNSQR